MKLLKLIALGLAVVAGSVQAQNLSIATGGTGGVYYPMGGGLASVLTKKVPGMSATAEVTGGSVDNLKLIGSGKPYIAFSMADAAKDAQDGLDKFAGRKVDVKTLLVLYPNRMHVVTVESTGIKSMKDLKGKRVSTGSPIKDRKIDAFFWVGGLPTAAVTDLANTPGTKIVMIDHAGAVDAMNKKYGNLYFKDTIPKATYSGMAADNTNASVSNILVVNGKMSDDEAYKITKAVFDNMQELIRTHGEYGSVKLANQKAASTPLPFHPGALKYFKENSQSVN